MGIKFCDKALFKYFARLYYTVVLTETTFSKEM